MCGGLGERGGHGQNPTLWTARTLVPPPLPAPSAHTHPPSSGRRKRHPPSLWRGLSQCLWRASGPPLVTPYRLQPPSRCFWTSEGGAGRVLGVRTPVLPSQLLAVPETHVARVYPDQFPLAGGFRSQTPGGRRCFISVWFPNESFSSDRPAVLENMNQYLDYVFRLLGWGGPAISGSERVPGLRSPARSGIRSLPVVLWSGSAESHWVTPSGHDTASQLCQPWSSGGTYQLLVLPPRKLHMEFRSLSPGPP